MSSGVKDEKPLALRVWSLNGGVIRIQLTRLADFDDADAIHGAIHAFTKALAGSRAPSDAALVEALEAVINVMGLDHARTCAGRVCDCDVEDTRDHVRRSARAALALCAALLAAMIGEEAKP